MPHAVHARYNLPMPVTCSCALTWRAVLQQVDGGGRQQRRQVLLASNHALLDAGVLGLVHVRGNALLQLCARRGTCKMGGSHDVLAQYRGVSADPTP